MKSFHSEVPGATIAARQNNAVSQIPDCHCHDLGVVLNAISDSVLMLCSLQSTEIVGVYFFWADF